MSAADQSDWWRQRPACNQWNSWIKGAKHINLAKLPLQPTYGEFLRWRSDVEHWVQMMSGEPTVPAEGVYGLSRLFLDYHLLEAIKAQRGLSPGTSWDDLLEMLKDFFGWAPLMLRNEMQEIKQGSSEPARAFLARLLILRSDALVGDD